MDLSSGVLSILFLYLFTVTKKGSATVENSLVLLNQNNDCIVCPGQILMFECSVIGVGSTVWRGSAFDCPLREIVLRHNQFVDSEGTCNDKAILARGVSVESGHYISQLNVTLSSSMNGETIMCAHYNITGTTIVGSFLVNFTSEQPPPPDNVHLSSVGSRTLTFSWNPVNSSCHALSYMYSINSVNCGVCPTITIDTSATCVSVSVDGSVCLFQVQTTVCNNNHGPLSTSVPIILLVPVISLVKTVPCFSERGRNFTEIQVSFNETDPFLFSDGVDGSATSYTINYTDTISGSDCGLATIPASSCSHRVCQNVLELSSSLCPFSDSITVTVFGTNALGNGTTSTPVSISTTNNYVRVTVDLLSAAIVCQFIDDQVKNMKSCSIAYRPTTEECDNMAIHSHVRNTTSTSDSVVINLPVLSDSIGMEYCYVATASNGTFTAMVKGTFSTVCNPTVLGNVPMLPMDVKQCEAPFHSLGVENGIVCYSGTEIGSVAFYSCLHCGLNGIMNGTSVRVCTENGVWNGSTPRCSCQLQTRTSEGNASNLVLTTALSIALVALIVTVSISVACSIAACILAKDRAKFKRQFEAKCIIYEEIDIKGRSPPRVDTTENVAYAIHDVSETV